MLYIYAVQRALPQYRDFRIAGEIVYPNRTVRVLQGGPARFVHHRPRRVVLAVSWLPTPVP